MRSVVDQVDVSHEPVGRPDRDGNRDRLARECLAQRVHRGLVGCVLLVHTVHDDERGDAGSLDHLPGHLGTHGDRAVGGDNQDGRVGDGQRFDHLTREVLEPRRVQEVDAVSVPVAVGDGQTDAHRVTLLLGFEVEQRGSLFGGPHALRCSRGVQQGFAESCLSVVAVPDDGDCADAIRCGRRHGESTPDRTPGHEGTNGSRSHDPS